MPLPKLSSVDARTKIDPRIGPIQGVHPNAKAIPINIGLKKFLFTKYISFFTKFWIINL